MLSADEHPGIFTFLIGIIVLVMAGVGLSLVIERRLKQSSEVVKMQREINLEALELEHLAAWYSKRSQFLRESELKLQKRGVTNKWVLSKLEILHQRQATLLEIRSELGKAISTIEEDFSHCRAEYRRKTRLKAVGENLGNLKVRNGREYLQATITRVTDVGLEIRHEDGIARIQAPDLDSMLQDRFQWCDAERRKILEAERENLEGSRNKGVVDDSVIGVNPR